MLSINQPGTPATFKQFGFFSSIKVHHTCVNISYSKGASFALESLSELPVSFVFPHDWQPSETPKKAATVSPAPFQGER